MSSARYIVVLVAVVSALQGTEAKPPSRVVGGDDGEIGEFPYTAALMKKNKHLCGAAIIDKRHVLTAAHCIHGVSKDPSKEMTVVTGANTVALWAGTSQAIKTVVVHPEYSDKLKDVWKNDIAVIALTKDIAFDAFTKPVLLPTEDTPGKRRCVASGWGDMSYPNGIRPINIRKLAMTTMSNAECNNNTRKYNVLDTHLCADEGIGTGLCSGDSGGPLVDDQTIVGIASFVLPCARGVPDVFTRVFAYLDFIKTAVAST